LLARANVHGLVLKTSVYVRQNQPGGILCMADDDERVACIVCEGPFWMMAMGGQRESAAGRERPLLGIPQNDPSPLTSSDSFFTKLAEKRAKKRKKKPCLQKEHSVLSRHSRHQQVAEATPPLSHQHLSNPPLPALLLSRLSLGLPASLALTRRLRLSARLCTLSCPNFRFPLCAA
jgi:hypothetical protein